jgi:hypothetical protein
MFHRFTKSKKRRYAALGIVAALALAGAAIAYFTSTGSGTATATVGSSTPLTVLQAGSITGLTPNGPIDPVQYTIANPVGKGNQNLGLVSASISSVTKAVGAPAGTCTASDFQITAAANPVGTINDGVTFTSSSTNEPSIQMKDTGVSQDGCQGATVNLALSAAQGS